MKLRVRIGFALTLWFFLVYFLSDYITSSRNHLYSVSVPLDQLVPFAPEFSIFYLSVSALLYLPLFLVRDRKRILVLALAFAAQIAFAGAIYMVFPVEASVSPEGNHGMIFALIDWVNLDYNSLPSLHVAMSTTAAWSVSRAISIPWRAFLWSWTGLVVLSTLFTKQHSLADVAAGLGIAWVTASAFVPASERFLSSRLLKPF